MTHSAGNASSAGQGHHAPPRVALITGASRRIGAAIARDLARHGTNVAIHHHASSEEAEALSEAIRKHGGNADTFAADLTDAVQTQTLFEAVREAMGPVELLVNNASIFAEDEAETFDAGTWDAHFAIHLRAPSQLASALAAQQDAGNGLVINMIDQRVWRLTPRFYSYTLSKSALWTATRTLAQALAPRIRVNAIGPGPTLPNERQSQADFDLQQAGLLLGKGPGLDEFGETVRYLWRAKSVTGQMIALDGGQHLAWETPDVAGIPE